MQNFIDSATNKFYAFDDDVIVAEEGGAYKFTASHGAPLTGIPNTLQPYTPPVLTAAQQQAADTAHAWSAYQGQASNALVESDKTVLRCYENAVALPAEWATYRKDLRAIVGATLVGDPTKPLPVRPAYPSGT